MHRVQYIYIYRYIDIYIYAVNFTLMFAFSLGNPCQKLISDGRNASSVAQFLHVPLIKVELYIMTTQCPFVLFVCALFTRLSTHKRADFN